MYASGKFLKYVDSVNFYARVSHLLLDLSTKFVRGALTNGREWIFLYLKFTDDYEGASYSQSSVLNWTVSVDLDGKREINSSWPDVITAILADWVCSIRICVIEWLTH